MAEVGAGNHVIKHTQSKTERKGEKNCKFVPQKKKRETFGDKEGAETYSARLKGGP